MRTPSLVDLGGIGGVGARDAPADVGVVADGGCEGEAFVAPSNTGLKMKMSGRCMPPSKGSFITKMSPGWMSSP